jgi:hypothetical protein
MDMETYLLRSLVLDPDLERGEKKKINSIPKASHSLQTEEESPKLKR